MGVSPPSPPPPQLLGFLKSKHCYIFTKRKKGRGTGMKGSSFAVTVHPSEFMLETGEKL